MNQLSTKPTFNDQVDIMMRMTTKRPPQQAEEAKDLIRKMKRAKISKNITDIKQDDDELVFLRDHHSRVVMTASPTSVGDHHADFKGKVCVIPGPLTFSSAPVDTNVLQTHPHVITPHASMMNLDDKISDTRTSVQDYSLSEKLALITLRFEQIEVVKSFLKSQVIDECIQSTPPASQSSDLPVKTKNNKDLSFRSFVTGLVVLCVVVFGANGVFFPRGHVGPNTVYVPGAGFSGFWFTLGRLRSIPEPASKDFYCFSAGCLGVVAIFSNFTIGEVSEMAIGVQSKWRTGEISQYQVVTKFLDVLLQRFEDDDTAAAQNGSTSSGENPLSLLPRLHVITSVLGKYYGMNHIIRTPQNVVELREMLLQTTWM